MATYEFYKELVGMEAFSETYTALTEQFRLWFQMFSDYKDHLTEAASSNSIQVSDGMTVVIGLVVVFAVLLVLTGIFYLFGFIMDSMNAPKKSKKATTSAPAATAAPVAVPAPVVQSGISGEVVAAIAAAVASMAPEGKRYAVRSVSRKDVGGRSAWAAAGIADNTRPF